MMTRNSALDKFLLSRKFIVCIIVLQFILLPIATKGFRWENIGDLIIYTLSHALIQGMYPYAWTFQIVSLVMLMLLVLRRVTMSRWFMFYVGGCYVLYAIVQNVAVTDKYGFSIVTVNVVMMLLVALLWMREAWREQHADLRQSEPKDSMADTRGTLCLWWPMDMMRGAEPDFSPIHLFAGGSAMAFCPMTPVFLVLLLLSKENIDLTLLRVTALVGFIIGCYNMGNFATDAGFYLGLYHLPLVGISLYALLKSKRKNKI